MSREDRKACQERWHDDLAAYALGALTRGDAAELERHLADCEACSDRLLWLQPAVDLVPASVPQHEPPPELRTNLMAIVEAEAAAEAAVAEPEPEPTPEPTPQPRPARRRWRLPKLGGLAPMRPALAGLATLAILFAGAGGYLLASAEDDGSAQTFAVKPLSPKLAASGELRVEGGSGTLTVENLPPIADDEVYQVWTSNGSEVQPSSIFVAERSGRGSAAVPEIPADTDIVLVTREPAGGSEKATTDPLLAATLD